MSAEELAESIQWEAEQYIPFDINDVNLDYVPLTSPGTGENIEVILVAFHWLFTSMGLDANAGITWVLAIVGLVLVVRAALIPIFVRQIKSQRKMLEIAPDLKKIQDKYKGKKDQFSREAMSRETMELYRRTGSNPLSSCLPLLLQMPIFFGLFSVLSEAQKGNAGIGFMTQQLAVQFSDASLFGLAPLHESFQGAASMNPPQALTHDHVWQCGISSRNSWNLARQSY